MELVLYTGIGGAEMFDLAIRTALGTGATATNSYYEAVGRQEVSDYAGTDGLVYGKYYKAYKTIHGHLIVVKVVNLFSNGLQNLLFIARSLINASRITCGIIPFTLETSLSLLKYSASPCSIHRL